MRHELEKQWRWRWISLSPTQRLPKADEVFCDAEIFVLAHQKAMSNSEKHTAAELFVILAIAVCIVFKLDIFFVFVFVDRSRSFQDNTMGIECHQAQMLQTTEGLQ
jgi:hypothetical protein